MCVYVDLRCVRSVSRPVVAAVARLTPSPLENKWIRHRSCVCEWEGVRGRKRVTVTACNPILHLSFSLSHRLASHDVRISTMHTVPLPPASYLGLQANPGPGEKEEEEEEARN